MKLESLAMNAPVQYIGPDDDYLQIYQGHPGRIVDLDELPTAVSVSFVGGPSLSLSLTEIEQISEATYRIRGLRTVGCLHPLTDRPIARFNTSGQEWPEGHLDGEFGL